jgi:hypothetical protein
LVVFGEDGPDESAPEDEKPVRVLTDFTVFDPKHNNELISLGVLEEEEDISDRHVEGAGIVSAYVVNEDEGQEDDIDEPMETLYVRLGAILRFSIDFTQIDAYVRFSRLMILSLTSTQACVFGDPVWLVYSQDAIFTIPPILSYILQARPDSSDDHYICDGSSGWELF